PLADLGHDGLASALRPLGQPGGRDRCRSAHQRAENRGQRREDGPIHFQALLPSSSALGGRALEISPKIPSAKPEPLLNVGARVMGVFAEEYPAQAPRGHAARAASARGGGTFGGRTRPWLPLPSGRCGRGGPAGRSGGRRISIAEAEAAVARRLFELYLSGSFRGCFR